MKIFNFIKRILKIIYKLLVSYSWLLDTILFIYLFGRNQGKTTFALLYLVAAIYCCYRGLKYKFLVYKSKSNILYDAYNSRVQCFEGPPGRGKTSLMNYTASLLKSDIFSNVPIKVYGDYVNILSSDLLSFKFRYPDNSVILIDEASLFYNNLDKTNCYDLEVLLQLIRHICDGNAFFATIKASRLPQQLREKIGLCKYLTGQKTIYDSLFFGQLFRFINYLLKIKCPSGIRVWQYQTFEDIDHSNYTFDLSSNESSVNMKHFSNLVECYAYNSSLKFEYNDRFMFGLVKDIPIVNPIKFNTLDYEPYILNTSNYGKLNIYFKNKLLNR